jgi:hypothetical protein
MCFVLVWEQTALVPCILKKLIGFYNRDEKCLQCGTFWVFKWSSLHSVFERLMRKSGTNISIYHARLFFKHTRPICSIRMNCKVWRHSTQSFGAMADVIGKSGGVRRQTNYVTAHRPFRNIASRQIQTDRGQLKTISRICLPAAVLYNSHDFVWH